MTSSKPKKEGIPDSNNEPDDLWKEFNGTCGGVTVPLSRMTFNLDVTGACTAGTLPETTDDKILALLTDIWHNQATIIKWLSKIAENTKKD